MLSIFSATIAYNFLASGIFSNPFEGCLSNRVDLGIQKLLVTEDLDPFSRKSELNCYILFTLSCCTKSRSLLDFLFCKFAF